MDRNLTELYDRLLTMDPHPLIFPPGPFALAHTNREKTFEEVFQAENVAGADYTRCGNRQCRCTNSCLLILLFRPPRRGCVQMAVNGVLRTQYDSECDRPAQPVCEHRACLTKHGRECVFPFRHNRTALDGGQEEVTYRTCSSLDVYHPWCPTSEA